MSEFRIEEKEAFRVIGTKIAITNKKKEGTKAIPLQWENFYKEGIQDKLLPLMNQEPYGLFSISEYNIDEDDAYKFNNYIAVSSNHEEGKFETYEVPANTWAIFPCTIETISKVEVQAITKWLPRSKYRPLNKGYITGKMKSGAPDITYYGKDNSVEVWVAVKEK